MGNMMPTVLPERTSSGMGLHSARTLALPMLALVILLSSFSCAPPRDTYDIEGDKNKEIIAKAFQQWQKGTANFFDLLDGNVEWTIAGTGLFSGIYKGKQHFMTKAVNPITDKLATRIKPELVGIFADGNTVWLHWKGTATPKAGGIYKNEYAWKLELKNGKIVKAVAFLDLIELEHLFSKKSNTMKSTIEETKEYIGMWITADGRIRHELLPGNRYDEARGSRQSAYQGSYKVTGNHIDYKDDTGFTADGEFREGILYHGGMVLYKNGKSGK